MVRSEIWEETFINLIARLVRDEAAIEAAARALWEARGAPWGQVSTPTLKAKLLDEQRAALMAWAEKVGAGG